MMNLHEHNTIAWPPRRVLLGLWSGLVLCLCAPPLAAHEIRPAVVDLYIQADGNYRLDLQVNMEALLAGVSPTHADTDQSPQVKRYNELRALPAAALEARIRAFWDTYQQGVSVEFDGVRSAPVLSSLQLVPPGDLARARLTRLQLTARIPPAAKTVRWTYAPQFGGSVLRLHRIGASTITAAWIREGTTSLDYPLDGAAVESSRAAIFGQYLMLGFTHILPKGLDHILFVLGLFLLSTRAAPLLWQVTAFTVAHSITLALSMYGILSLSAAVVEPLIAASIVYVAVENMVTARLHTWRVFVVFAFGLLHGLGFAGVLAEIGLPRNEFVTGLIAFNVGVEGGQLTVIALAALLFGYWFRLRPWYRTRIVLPLSAAIALIGLYWTVERFAG